MEINSPSTASEYSAGNLREGNLDSKVLLRGREGSLNNLRLSFETAKGSWSTPRHRHNFDQIRLPISGVVEYGSALPTLPAGVVAYFPESVRYGPQVRHDESLTLTLQFGGASANGFLSPEERGRGFQELKQKGKFEGGVFSYTDDKGQRHNQDAYEAVWEYMRGRKMVYEAPRYGSQVVMDPAAFQWVRDEHQSGVSKKVIGVFTERQVMISCIRIEPGAKFQLSRYPAPQVLFVVDGSVSHQGKLHAQHTAFGIETGEGPHAFSGVEPNQLLLVQLPIFSADEHAAFEKGSTTDAV